MQKKFFICGCATLSTMLATTLFLNHWLNVVNLASYFGYKDSHKKSIPAINTSISSPLPHWHFFLWLSARLDIDNGSRQWYVWRTDMKWFFFVHRKKNRFSFHFFSLSRCSHLLLYFFLHCPGFQSTTVNGIEMFHRRRAFYHIFYGGIFFHRFVLLSKCCWARVQCDLNVNGKLCY